MRSSPGVLSVFSLRIVLTLIMWPSGSNSALKSSLFQKFPIQGTHLEVYEIQHGVKSSISCAGVCAQRQHQLPSCLAFDYNPLDWTCDLYTKGSSSVDVSSLHVFLNQGDFQSIFVDGHFFFIHLSSTAMTYLQGRTYCNDLGGYLLQFDSLEEHRAVEIVTSHMVTTGSTTYSYVGANDLSTEGHWVTDRESMPLNNDLWFWANGEPSNGNELEDAAVISYLHNLKMLDIDHTRPMTVLCEKDI